MLCDVCAGMLSSGRGLIWTGTFDPTFDHHKTSKALLDSTREECSICMALAKFLEPTGILAKDQPISIRAHLDKVRNVPTQGAKFLLDFVLEGDHKYTFLLTEKNPNQKLRPIKSINTSSEEVTSVAKNWLGKCSCAGAWEEPGEKWYPRRLLDIQPLRSAKSSLHRAKVYLVESSEFTQETIIIGATRVLKHPNYRYVTLSHCWGKFPEGQGPLKLTSVTMERFMIHGIELQELPKTFQDALLFACRLEGVRFVWIDSLCIRQPLKGPGYNDEEQLSDWVEQSRFMDRVYWKAYLNISATASIDGNGGLFYDRNPARLLDDEIVVHDPTHQFTHSLRDGADISDDDDRIRCTVSNAATWVELVDQAPINKRGWVLQERLLAPRVLHFCHDQIAWECAEFEDAESFPEAMTTLRTELQGAAPHGRIKDLSINAGVKARNVRLRGLLDPDLGMEDLYVYELWKRVVEMYSQTDLSFPTDKLMALAGIAGHFHQHLFSTGTAPNYLAGLWSNHLESQLLWHVNEVYQKGEFKNPAKRIAGRAPSFTWAAVDTSQGITYGDTTDYGSGKIASKKRVDHESKSEHEDPTEDLLCKVIDYSVTLFDEQNAFGMIKEAHLLLEPRYLREIYFEKLPPKRRVPYGWRLKHRVISERPSRKDYTNIYLDAPNSDSDIFDKDVELYCLPVAFGERTVRKESRYLYCLLLKYEGDIDFCKPGMPHSEEKRFRGFKRIGITKLSSYADGEGQRQVMAEEANELIILL